MNGRAAASFWDRIAQADDVFGFLEDPATSLPLDHAQGVGAGRLAGQVIGVKSNISVEGQAWTAGIGARRAPAAGDAPVIKQMRAAGAQILSRLVMDEAALGAAGDNPHFGQVENPARPGFSAGGSSGGSAASVASGALRLALGSDTLGSVRIPAAYCGVVGLKPAPGGLPLDGVLPLAPGFDALGILGASLAEVATLYGLFDATAPGSELGLCVPAQMSEIPCAPGARAALDRTAQAAAVLGRLAPARSVPGWQPAAARKAAFAELCARASQSLAGLDGLSAGVQRSLAYGARLAPEKRAEGLEHLKDLAAGLGSMFDEGLVLLTPTTPSGSFPHGTPPPKDQASFTALANVAGAASLSIPLAGDPLQSVMLTGAAGTEASLLDIAQSLTTAMAG